MHGDVQGVKEHVTKLLIDWGAGNREALDLLTPIVYAELHKTAAAYLAQEQHAPTMQPTALIHEAYIRLVSQALPDWQSRSHFYGVAAQIMRQILVDHARKRRSRKRGGGEEKLGIEEAMSLGDEREGSIVVLDDALRGLEKIDPRKARVIELRFFGGMSVDETAHVLGVSVATVGREQRLAEAWLHKEISGQTAGAARP